MLLRLARWTVVIVARVVIKLAKWIAKQPAAQESDLLPQLERSIASLEARLK